MTKPTRTSARRMTRTEEVRWFRRAASRYRSLARHPHTDSTWAERYGEQADGYDREADRLEGPAT